MTSKTISLDQQQQAIELSLHQPQKKAPQSLYSRNEWEMMWEKCQVVDPGMPVSLDGAILPQESAGELSADEGVTATVEDGTLIIHVAYVGGAEGWSR